MSMRIGSEVFVSDSRIQSTQAKAQQKIQAYGTDVVAVGSRVAEARAADMDVRQAQNTMTLFRIAESSLSDAAGALDRLAQISTAISSDDVEAFEINTLATEGAMMSSRFESAISGASMGGVKLFSGSPESQSMWKVASGNAVVMLDVAEGIEDFAMIGADALGIEGLKPTDAGAAGSFGDAAKMVRAASEIMGAGANALGEVVLEMTRDAVGQLSGAAGSTGVRSGLMKFIIEEAGE